MAKLFMALIGCKPPGRNIEQHDIFFGVGETMKDLVPAIAGSWPETNGKIHIDAWREVNQVNGHNVRISASGDNEPSSAAKLFFINLGGYKQNEFEEFHYKMIIAAPGISEAISLSKNTAFFKHTAFKGADSHIDDKYGIDVDDVIEVKDILPEGIKTEFRILVTRCENAIPEDEIHLGYFKLNSFS